MAEGGKCGFSSNGRAFPKAIQDGEGHANTSKENFDVSKSYLRIIDSASALVIQEGNALTEISKEIGEMGAWSLFWDRKVAEKDKGFFNFTFASSDPESLKTEVKKYATFYGQVKDAMCLIRTGKNGGIAVLEEMVDDLYEKLEALSQNAESGIDSTTSRKLKQVHEKFVAEHHKLEVMVRRVESAGMREKQKMLIAKMDEYVGAMDRLTRELEDAKKDKAEIKRCVEDLKADNEKSNAHWNESLQNLTKQLEEAKKDKDDMKKCVEDLRADNESSRTERSQLLDQNTKILAALESLIGKKQ